MFLNKFCCDEFMLPGFFVVKSCPFCEIIGSSAYAWSCVISPCMSVYPPSLEGDALRKATSCIVKIACLQHFGLKIVWAKPSWWSMDARVSTATWWYFTSCEWQSIIQQNKSLRFIMLFIVAKPPLNWFILPVQHLFLLAKLRESDKWVQFFVIEIHPFQSSFFPSHSTVWLGRISGFHSSSTRK